MTDDVRYVFLAHLDTRYHDDWQRDPDTGVMRPPWTRINREIAEARYRRMIDAIGADLMSVIHAAQDNGRLQDQYVDEVAEYQDGERSLI